jgi:DNA-directed RNA polymerase subunit beta'
MTRERLDARGTGHTFSSFDEVRIAYDQGEVDLQAKIKVRVPESAGGSNQLVDSTIGRVLLYEIVPAEIPSPTSTR